MDVLGEMLRTGALFSATLPTFVVQEMHNYIDPGTGSLIIQVVIASFVGALFAIKVYWNRVKAFFRSLFKNRRK